MAGGIVGKLSSAMDKMHACMGGGKATTPAGGGYMMSDADMKQLMELMQSVHQDITGAKWPLKNDGPPQPQTPVQPPPRKAGVVYATE